MGGCNRPVGGSYVRATGRGVRPVFWGKFAPGLLVGTSLSGQHQRPRNWNPRARGITPVVSDMKLRACSQRNHVFSKARPVGGSGGNSLAWNSRGKCSGRSPSQDLSTPKLRVGCPDIGVKKAPIASSSGTPFCYLAGYPICAFGYPPWLSLHETK